RAEAEKSGETRIVLKTLKPGTASARSQYNHTGSRRKVNMMNAKNSKLIVGMLALSLALPLALTTGQAQSGPSAKVTAKTSNVNLINATTGTNDWATISGFGNTIKTANQKDLFIGVSLEVGLYTQTLVKSKNLVSDTSTAHSSVEIRVLVDGKAAEPGPVVYGRRTQTLTA